ncbi:MAG: histone deacetylase [Verrucomicrobiota bacterium]
MATALLTDPIFRKHITGRHPESPKRMAAIEDRLASDGLAERCLRIGGRLAKAEEMALAHEESYLDRVQKEVTDGRGQLTTGDTVISEDSYLVVSHVVGGVLQALDKVFQKEVENAFCVARPPGHHASADVGMGFCLVNQVAIAARYAQAKYGVERVAILDWDVHHGNGTQDIFYDDPSVYYASLHQAPWFPGTGWPEERGQGKGEGMTLNIPMAAGAAMAEFDEAIRGTILPALRDYAPDLVLISAGFDSRAGDPLGGFQLKDEDFRELTLWMRDLAETCAENRVVSVLEGGYALDGLASASASHLGALLE